MNTITIKIDNLQITRYTTLSGLNITLARYGQCDGLFTYNEATQLITFLETQPIDQAKISDIKRHESVTIDNETGETEVDSPYQMAFGSGGFRANLRDWCAEYPLSFDVQVLFFEYDDDYTSVRTHLESTYKLRRKKIADKFRTEMVLYESIADAARFLDVSERTVSRRLKSNDENWEILKG